MPRLGTRVARRHDLLAQRSDGHGGQLEVPEAERDPDDGEAEHHAEDEVGQGHPQPRQDEPEDVGHRRRVRRPPGLGTTARPNGHSTNAASRKQATPKGMVMISRHSTRPASTYPIASHKPEKHQPEQIQHRSHRSPSSSRRSFVTTGAGGGGALPPPWRAAPRAGSPTPRRRAGRAARRRQRPGEQPVGQRRVARQHRTVEVRPDDAARHGTLAPSPSPLPTPARTRPSGTVPSRQRRRAAVVLEAGQDGQRVRAPGPPRPAPRPPPAGRPPSPCRRRGGRRPRAHHPSAPGKLRPTIWNPAQTARTTAPPATPPGQRAVLDERAGGADLGTVLSPAQAVDVGLGERAVGGRLQQLGVEAAPRGPPGQHQPVPAVTVGAQQVGVDDRDPQRAVMRGAPNRSWNAV